MRDGKSETSVKISQNNVKLTRAIIVTLTAYILLYAPIISVTCARTFIVDFPWDILEDIALLFYFSNNLVNPFIYYMTLRDFREGYMRLLLFCVRHPYQGNSTVKVAVIGGS